MGICLAMGNIFTYWVLLVFCWRTDESNDITIPHYSLRILSVVACGFLLTVAFISIPRNFSDSNGKSAAFVDNTVKLLMDEIKGKEVLLTDGLFDMNIHMMKKQNNTKLSVIRIPPEYSRLNINQKRPDPAPFKLMSMNEVRNRKPNVQQFLSQWMRKHRNSSDKIASFTDTQIWNNAGVIPVPQGLL